MEAEVEDEPEGKSTCWLEASAWCPVRMGQPDPKDSPEFISSNSPELHQVIDPGD